MGSNPTAVLRRRSKPSASISAGLEAKMAKSQDQTASYMMLCLGDFASMILIPAKFVRKYEEIDRQVSVTLENDSGKSWDVKLKRMNGDLYMTDGWAEFVKENGIIEPYFLTFRLLMLPRSFTFKVSIYRSDGCIKHFGGGDVEILHENVNKNVNGGVSGIKRGRGRPSKFHAGGDVEILHKNVIKRGRRGRPSKIHAGNGEKTWRFVKELKDYNFLTLRMEMPKPFAVGTQIGMKGYAELENSRGRRWMVSVTNRGIRMFSMTLGWIHFLRENNLQVGNILLFEFVANSDNVVKVTVMENEVGKDMLARARKGGLIWF